MEEGNPSGQVVLRGVGRVRAVLAAVAHHEHCGAVCRSQRQPPGGRRRHPPQPRQLRSQPGPLRLQ